MVEIFFKFVGVGFILWYGHGIWRALPSNRYFIP